VPMVRRKERCSITAKVPSEIFQKEARGRTDARPETREICLRGQTQEEERARIQVSDNLVLHVINELLEQRRHLRWQRGGKND
jgi:hypothetical protein